jgi:hypothetical protein
VIVARLAESGASDSTVLETVLDDHVSRRSPVFTRHENTVD